jgi:hypothetical protein
MMEPQGTHADRIRRSVAHARPRACPARGTVVGEALFLVAAVWVAAGAIADLLRSAFFAVLFAFRRGKHRARMRALIVDRPGAALSVAAICICLLSACAGQKTVPTGEAWTLKGQAQQFNWSLHALADQSDSQKSLQDDLQDLGTDPHWPEHMRFSVESLFLMPDARQSMESTLRDLGDDDSKKHGLRETIEMLGW